MWDFIPKMSDKKDLAKLITAIIVLGASVLLNDRFDSGNEELVTAIAVIVSYLVGLYSDTYGKDNTKDE